MPSLVKSFKKFKTALYRTILYRYVKNEQGRATLRWFTNKAIDRLRLVLGMDQVEEWR